MADQDASLLPVLVWIHGGGYTSGAGTSAQFGPLFYLAHGVIVVTVRCACEDTLSNTSAPTLVMMQIQTRAPRLPLARHGGCARQRGCAGPGEAARRTNTR